MAVVTEETPQQQGSEGTSAARVTVPKVVEADVIDLLDAQKAALSNDDLAALVLKVKRYACMAITFCYTALSPQARKLRAVIHAFLRLTFLLCYIDLLLPLLLFR